MRGRHGGKYVCLVNVCTEHSHDLRLIEGEQREELLLVGVLPRVLKEDEIEQGRGNVHRDDIST